MSDKKTMQLEYKFMAEDTNLSSTIDKMESSLESFNGETKEVVNNLNKAEKEMREFATSTAQAKKNIKDAESAFEYLNSTSKQNSKTMDNLAQDMVKATTLTKQLAKEQKRLFSQTNRVQSKGATASQITDLTNDINTYRGQIVELNNLDKRLANGYKTLQANRAIAQKGYQLAEDGSYEKEYFANKRKAIDESLNAYRTKMNSVAKEKESIIKNFNRTNKAFDRLLEQNNIEIIGSENGSKNTQKSSKNNTNNNQNRTKNNPQYTNRTNKNQMENYGTFRNSKGLTDTNDNSKVQNKHNYTPRKPIGLTDSEIQNLEKSEAILAEYKMLVDDNKYQNRMAESAQAHQQEMTQYKEKVSAEKELIELRTEAENVRDLVKTENDIKKYQANTQAKIELDNNRSANKQTEMTLSKQLKSELNKETLEYKQQLKAVEQTNKTRKNLVDNINKEANKYKNMSKSAQNYRADLVDIEKQADKVVKQNVLQADSFDAVDKKMRTKSKSMLTLANRYEDYQVKTKSLLQQSVDYQKVLSDQKIKIEADIDDLKKVGTESGEAKAKLEKLETELEQTEAKMKELETATNKLTSELNQAGGELIELGNDFDKLENKIDGCKSSIDGFSNKMATIATSTANFAGKMQNVGQGIANFGNRVRSVGTEIMNVGREMQVLSIVGAGIFGGAIAQGLEYEGELANVKSTINTVGKEAGYLDKAMDQISEKARNISSNSVYSPTEVMESAKYLSLAGYDLEKILTMLEPMTNLMALSGLEDASEGVDLLTDSLASLGLGIQDLKNNEPDFQFAKRFQEEATLYMDTLAKMQSVSNQDISEAMNAFIYAGGEFDRLNIPLEQSGALLSTLASRGLKSAEAGRGLSSTLINLTKESGQSYQALKELHELTGIDVFARFDENGAYKLEQQLTNINAAFEKIYKDYGNEKGAEIVNRLTGGIAGKTQIKTFTKLMEGYKQEYSQIKQLLSEGYVEGSLNEMMDRKKESIEYKFKMMVASIQESLVDLFNIIKPYVEKVIDTIKSLSDAFKKLSDEEKLGLAKLLALITALPFLVVAFGAVIAVIGTVINVFGNLTKAVFGVVKVIALAVKNVSMFITSVNNLGFVEALATKFPLISGQIKNLSLGLAEAGATATATGGKFLGFFTSLGKIGGIIGAVIAFINNVKVAIAGLGDSFKEAGGAFEWFIKFLKDPLNTLCDMFMNIGKQFEHFILSGFKSIAPKLTVAMVNIGRFITKGFMALIPGLTKLIGDNVDSWFDTLEQKAKEFSKEVQGVSSMLDEEAQAKGFANYEEQKNSSKTFSVDFEFNGLDALDTFANGAISKLLNIHQNGEAITFETIGRSQEALSEIVSQYKTINKLKTQTNNAIKKESELSAQILKVRQEMSKYEKGSEKYNELQEEYYNLVEEKKVQVELRLSNQEEIEKQLAELEEKKAIIKVEYEEAEKQGLGDEYIYYNLNKEFETEFGIPLVFDNKNEIEANLTSVLDGIPEDKKQIEIALETAEGEDRNKLVSMLAKLEGMELAIPVAFEIVKEEEILKQYGGADGEVAKKKQIVEELEVKIAGVEEGGKAWEELTSQLKTAKEEYEEALSFLNGANDALAELEKKNPQIFQNALELAKHLTENKTEAMFKLFDDEELMAYERLTGTTFFDFNTNRKTEPQKSNSIIPEGAQKKEPTTPTEYREDVGLVFNIGYETDGTGLKESIQSDVEGAEETTKTITLEKPKLIDDGETPITDSTKNDIEGAEEALSAISFEKPELIDEDTTPITDNIEQDVEGATSKLEELQGKAQETLSAFGSIDMSNLVEVFAVVLALADEVRQRLIDIGNVANNSLKNNLAGSADGLLEKLALVREKLIGLGDVANNYVRASLADMLGGFMENISIARDAVIGLGNVANNYLKNCLNGAGDGLKTSFNSAREVLLSICNVALNRGVSSMQSVGNSLTTSLEGARNKLLSICNVALNRGISSMSQMGQALSASLSSALSIVNRVASTIDSAVRKANSIKIPTIPTAPSVGTVAFSQPQALSSVMRTSNLSNNSSNTINTSSSSFNFAIDKVISNSNADLKNSARRLTTYCKRRGLF